MRSFTFGVNDHGDGKIEIMLENHQQPDDGTYAERLMLSLAIGKLMDLSDAASKGCEMAVKRHYRQPGAAVMNEVKKFSGRTQTNVANLRKAAGMQ